MPKSDATLDSFREAIPELRAEYPSSWHWYIDNNYDRFAWQAYRLHEALGALDGRHIIDVGASFSMCAPLLARFGAKVTIIDDFDDPMYRDPNTGQLEDLFDRLGIEIISGDVFAIDLPFEAGSLDGVLSFDSMEHWHQSPKELFHDLFSRLGNSGVFFIGVPNAVNLRKRISAPLGLYQWSSMDEWYEQTPFRGHVREPCVRDLAYIAKDLGSSEFSIEGKNWIGYRSKNAAIRRLTPLVDRLLQLQPSLCSDIYLIAQK